MKNVTVTLDDETARWARLEAARREKSVSALIRDLLREHMSAEERYDEAMRKYLSKPARPLKGAGQRYPSREELYER